MSIFAPSRATLILSAALLLGLAAGATAAEPPRVPAAIAAWLDLDRRANAQLVAQLNTVRMALEQHGTEANGAYPLDGQWAAALTAVKGEYALPGGRLPANPWASDGAPIRTTADRWPAALPKVTPVARGEVAMARIGTDLGPGRAPGEPGPPGALVYGTLLYGYEPNHQVYVVYAIGKRGDRAILVGATSNGSC